MNKGNSISAVMAIAVAAINAAHVVAAANFPVGTHLVKGTLKDWQNKVLTSSAAVTIQAVNTNGSAQLDDEAWIATMSGLDGTSDSAATIRRHSMMRAGGDFTSTRLVGRSVWNDKWLLVIPASSLNADRVRALDTFINGVGDIRLGIRAYSRSGN